MTLPLDLIRPREITGMSAILLPMLDPTTPDWDAFDAHVARTAAAGLVPAVNMDTGYAHLLDAATKTPVLDRTEAIVGGEFVAGAFDLGDAVDDPRAGRDAGDRAERPHCRRRTSSPPTATIAEAVDRFIGFELSPLFHPAGRIWDLATYKEVLHIEQCVGAKHSSLEREPEWERLRVARRRASRLPRAHRQRPRHRHGDVRQRLPARTLHVRTRPVRDAVTSTWADGDARFYELNDALQHLGNVAFRPPVPAYRHSAALFLRMRGWIASDATPDGVPRAAGLGRSPAAAVRRTAGPVVTAARRWPQVKRLDTCRRVPSRGSTSSAITLPFADPPAVDALAAPLDVAGRRAPNRFAILPMEGWDGTDDGRPTDLVRRRWARFGSSGAGLVWGGEAFAVRPDGRANPHQLCLGPSSADDLAELRSLLADEQVAGLQLTHSGRWALDPRPGRAEPLLDRASRRTADGPTPSSTSWPTTTPRPPCSRRAPGSTSWT